MATNAGVVNGVDITLDGAAVAIGEDGKAKAVRIEAGAYATPFWVRVVGGIAVRVNALPWQGVLPAP